LAHSGIGHYVANTLVMVALVLVSYCMVGLAVFGSEGINGRGMDPEGVLQMLLAGMGLLQTMPLFVTLSVEKGLDQAIAEIAYMILSGGPLYFIFHIQTKSFYFMQTIMAGGAKYRPTGRGFVIRHSPFDENYRFFARSHIYVGFELFMALLLLSAYTTSKQYFGLTWAIWLTVASFMFGPFWFNPLSFETSKTTEDYVKWLAWMQEVGGTSEQSWAAWWKEENAYVAKLSVGWKLILVVIRGAIYGTLAVGIFGGKFVSNSREQERVLTLLAVFMTYLLTTWFINKLEQRTSYAFRRLAHFFTATVSTIVVATLYAKHTMYFKYSIALYYSGAMLANALLMMGFMPVIIVFQLHDYLVGHTIFILLYVASVLQMGYMQTWLLYHNALSSGVEIEAVLKYARQNQARGGSAGRADTVMDELREQVAEQAKTIRQLISGLTKATAGGGVAVRNVSELHGLLDEFNDRGGNDDDIHGGGLDGYGAAAGASVPLSGYGATTSSKPIVKLSAPQPTEPRWRSMKPTATEPARQQSGSRERSSSREKTGGNGIGIGIGSGIGISSHSDGRSDSVDGARTKTTSITGDNIHNEDISGKIPSTGVNSAASSPLARSNVSQISMESDFSFSQPTAMPPRG
jgi:callose synthase